MPREEWPHGDQRDDEGSPSKKKELTNVRLLNIASYATKLTHVAEKRSGEGLALHHRLHIRDMEAHLRVLLETHLREDQQRTK